MSALASSTTDGTILLNVVINDNVEGEAENKTFADAYYGMMDLNTYNTTFDKEVEPGEDGKEWVELKGYNIKYFKDVENGVYVFDLSAHEAQNGVENSFVINKTADQLSKVVVVQAVQQQQVTDIKFIADFN